MIEGLKTVSTILAIVSWSGIILFGTFVYFRFAPTIKLSIEPRWEGNNSEYLVIKFVAENKSRIRIYLSSVILGKRAVKLIPTIDQIS